MAQVADNSKEAVAQQAFIAGVNDSPRMLAQRRQIENYLGPGRPQISESVHPASPINQQQTIQCSEKSAAEENIFGAAQRVEEGNSLQRKLTTESPVQPTLVKTQRHTGVCIVSEDINIIEETYVTL